MRTFTGLLLAGLAFSFLALPGPAHGADVVMDGAMDGAMDGDVDGGMDGIGGQEAERQERMRAEGWLAGKILYWVLLPPVAATQYAVEHGELSGEAGTEVRLFPRDPLVPEQSEHGASVFIEPELYVPFGETAHSATLTPFGRYDWADEERSHWDLREAYINLVFDRWELSVGARKVFWGVAETAHIVDVINQTDLVENPDGEDKLGQPMAQLTVPGESGTLDLFLLPYFRERTFPGREGRLRPSAPVDTDFVLYEDKDRRRHLDWAARYKHYLGPLEMAVSHFSGTSREPVLLPQATCLTLAVGCPPGVLVPYYQLIDQTGLEGQLIVGEWLLKLEGIRRAGQGDPFYAGVAGFEYTFVGVFGTAMDLGVLSEWLGDSRPGGTTPLDNDIAFGLRLAVNDIQSTELLMAAIADPDTGAWAAFLETSRRLGAAYTASGEVRWAGGVEPGDPLYDLRRDGYIQLSVSRHF